VISAAKFSRYLARFLKIPQYAVCLFIYCTQHGNSFLHFNGCKVRRQLSGEGEIRQQAVELYAAKFCRKLANYFAV